MICIEVSEDCGAECAERFSRKKEEMVGSAARRFLLPTFLAPSPMSRRVGDVCHVSLGVSFGRSTMMQVLILGVGGGSASMVEMDRQEVGFTMRRLSLDPSDELV